MDPSDSSGNVRRIHVDEAVIQQLTEVADTLATMVSHMAENQNSQSRDIEYFRDELRLARESIRRIAKVLHEGNGERPLISRVAVLENQIVNLVEDVSLLQEHEEQRLKFEKEAKNIGAKGKYALAGAVISGVVALVTSILSFLAG